MPSARPGALRVLTRPSMLLLHVGGVAAVGFAVLLGYWQLGAWQDHRRDYIAEAAARAPVSLASLIGPDSPFPRDGVGRPVEFIGTWLPGDTVLVSGRLHDGSEGFWVVTPAAVCAQECPAGAAPADSAIPVVVGWTADAAVRGPAPTGTAELTGWLQPGEGSAEADTDPGDDIVPTLRVTDLLNRMDRDLYSGYVILDGPASARGDLVAVTPDSLPRPPASTALRNLLYAVEWWFFGAFALFLWTRWCHDELQRSAAPDLDPELGAGPDTADTADDVPTAGLPSSP